MKRERYFVLKVDLVDWNGGGEFFWKSTSRSTRTERLSVVREKAGPFPRNASVVKEIKGIEEKERIGTNFRSNALLPIVE